MVGYKETERDKQILITINKWRFCLGRQIKILCNFSGQRACDRRLKKLIEVGYIEKRHVIYGIPYLYFVTRKAVKLFGLEFYTPNVRIDQIHHNIAVIDAVIMFIKSKDLKIDRKTILSDRELKHKNGFGNPKHEPDFIYTSDGNIVCVEIELSLKSKTRLEKNIKNNYTTYDGQLWIVPESQVKINEILKENINKYSDIKIIPYETVQEYVKSL